MICRCWVTSNVDVILQSEVDQTDKINTIISNDPKWAGMHPDALTEHWRETNHHTQFECDDCLLVVCRILLQKEEEEEQLLSTFYFLSIFQEVWRRSVGEHWYCTRLVPLNPLTVKRVQKTAKLSDRFRKTSATQPVCLNHAFSRGCYCLHKPHTNAPYCCRTSLWTRLQTETDTNKKVLAVLQADTHICIALTWNIIWQCYKFWSITLIKAWTK